MGTIATNGEFVMFSFLLFSKDELEDIKCLGDRRFDIPPRGGVYRYRDRRECRKNTGMYKGISIIYLTSLRAKLSINTFLKTESFANLVM